MLKIYTSSVNLDPSILAELDRNKISFATEYTFLIFANDNETAVKLVYNYIGYSHKNYDTFQVLNKNRPALPMEQHDIAGCLSKINVCVDELDLNEAIDMIHIMKYMNDLDHSYHSIIPRRHGIYDCDDITMYDYAYYPLLKSVDMYHRFIDTFILDNLKWTSQITSIRCVLFTNEPNNCAAIMNEYMRKQLLNNIKIQYGLWFHDISIDLRILRPKTTDVPVVINNDCVKIHAIDLGHIRETIQNIMDNINKNEIIFIICDKDSIPESTELTICSIVGEYQIADEVYQQHMYMTMTVYMDRDGSIITPHGVKFCIPGIFDYEDNSIVIE